LVWKRKGTEEEVKTETPKQPEEKPEEKEMVVNELPQLPQRVIRGDDGKIYHLTTLSEAVQEILENTREILRFARE